MGRDAFQYQVYPTIFILPGPTLFRPGGKEGQKKGTAEVGKSGVKEEEVTRGRKKKTDKRWC